MTTTTAPLSILLLRYATLLGLLHALVPSSSSCSVASALGAELTVVPKFTRCAGGAEEEAPLCPTGATCCGTAAEGGVATCAVGVGTVCCEDDEDDDDDDDGGDGDDGGEKNEGRKKKKKTTACPFGYTCSTSSSSLDGGSSSSRVCTAEDEGIERNEADGAPATVRRMGTCAIGGGSSSSGGVVSITSAYGLPVVPKAGAERKDDDGGGGDEQQQQQQQRLVMPYFSTHGPVLPTDGGASDDACSSDGRGDEEEDGGSSDSGKTCSSETTARNEKVKTAVLFLHGYRNNYDADTHICSVLSAAAAHGGINDLDEVLVLAPWFLRPNDDPTAVLEAGLEEEDDKIEGGSRKVLKWDHDDSWRYGGKGQAVSTTNDLEEQQVGSFDVMDAFVDVLTTSESSGMLFPNLETITVVGDSYGADLALRWSLVSTVDAWDDDDDREGGKGGDEKLLPNLRVVAIAPYEYTYLTPQRYVGPRWTLTGQLEETCPGYDSFFGYGLADAPESVDRTLLAERYRRRDVTYLIGERDTATVSDDDDLRSSGGGGGEDRGRRCAGALQGYSRFERLAKYRTSLTDLVWKGSGGGGGGGVEDEDEDDDNNTDDDKEEDNVAWKNFVSVELGIGSGVHRVMIGKGTGHDGPRMVQTDCGLLALFGPRKVVEGDGGDDGIPSDSSPPLTCKSVTDADLRRISASPPPQAPNPSEVSIVFENQGESRIESYWVGDSRGEVRVGTIESNDEYRTSSFHGHRFVFREEVDGEGGEGGEGDGSGGGNVVGEHTVDRDGGRVQRHVAVRGDPDKVFLIFDNQAASRIDLFWVGGGSGDEEEVLVGTIDGNGEHRITSFHNHRFVFRAEGRGDVVGEHTVARDGGRKQKIVVVRG